MRILRLTPCLLNKSAARANVRPFPDGLVWPESPSLPKTWRGLPTPLPAEPPAPTTLALPLFLDRGKIVPARGLRPGCPLGRDAPPEVTWLDSPFGSQPDAASRRLVCFSAVSVTP